jgi:DNA-binding CsgD family transcriptional regulator
MRAKRVVALSLSGVGSAQIAERTGISQRRVNQILSSGKTAP